MTSARLGDPATSSPSDHYCFIIHSAIPYCYDFNTILALPSGFRYRNRFDTPWVDPNLHQNITALVGERVLLILRDQENNRLIPVRWATINVAQQIGRIYYFEYLLGDLIAYESDDLGRTEQLNKATARFHKYHPELPGAAGHPLHAPSVFRSAAGNALSTSPADDLTAWGAATSAVASADIFNRVEFLKVLGMFDLDNNPCPVANESFLVRPNTVYQLRVFQTIPRPDSAGTTHPHDIEIECFEDHVVQLRARQRAVGKYDMLNFVLKTRRLPPQERSALQIPLRPDHIKGNFAPSSLYIPLTATGRSARAVLLWTLAVAATLLLMFKPSLVPLDEDTVRNIATVIFVLLISGWTTTASSLMPDLPWIRR